MNVNQNTKGMYVLKVLYMYLNIKTISNICLNRSINFNFNQSYIKVKDVYFNHRKKIRCAHDDVNHSVRYLHIC
jgi:hypothetical protein